MLLAFGQISWLLCCRNRTNTFAIENFSLDFIKEIRVSSQESFGIFTPLTKANFAEVEPGAGLGDDIALNS